MKYFVIAGEASGDLHARHLMSAIARRDEDAEIRYWYRPDLAYMGFVPVIRHLRAILRGERDCKASIEYFRPDRLVLVDYPGFNLRIARWFKARARAWSLQTYDCDSGQHMASPESEPEVIYYIAPKVWAWKEYRVRDIKRCVDKVLSILPFEVEWFRTRHDYRVHYVGNPTMDEVNDFLRSESKENDLKVAGTPETESRLQSSGQSSVIALLPGSRMQEIDGNLPRMIESLEGLPENFGFVIAMAPGIDRDIYESYVQGSPLKNRIVLAENSGGDARSTFRLLQGAVAALVTSGTATLEAALMGVPQVVCYWMRWGRVANVLKRIVLRVPYVSLVNLICGREVVPELVAVDMTPEHVRRQLLDILPGGAARDRQLEGYRELWGRLKGGPASEMAATIITNV